MSSQNSVKTKDLLENSGPELNAFIYQKISEFEPYMTEKTSVAVVAKNPLSLISKLEDEGVDISKKELRKMHRVAIMLSEDGTSIEAEGLNEDIYEAINQAKEKLLAKLADIHDSVVSAQDRAVQIQNYLNAGHIH